MIFSVSLRRSGNRQLAEEATQNVLISLAQKARKLSVQESNLAGWLYTATKFEVSKLQRRESRIKMREQAYATEQMNAATHDDEENFKRLLPMLDQAIDTLRPQDREVIVRRYLEGQDFSRIGKALGISEDTAQKRTSRAFESLNHFFKRKTGVTVSATALASGISQHCAEAAPAVCLQFIAKAPATGLASILTTAAITTTNARSALTETGASSLSSGVAKVSRLVGGVADTTTSPATITTALLPSASRGTDAGTG